MSAKADEAPVVALGNAHAALVVASAVHPLDLGLHIYPAAVQFLEDEQLCVALFRATRGTHRRLLDHSPWYAKVMPQRFAWMVTTIASVDAAAVAERVKSAWSPAAMAVNAGRPDLLSVLLQCLPLPGGATALDLAAPVVDGHTLFSYACWLAVAERSPAVRASAAACARLLAAQTAGVEVGGDECTHLTWAARAGLVEVVQAWAAAADEAAVAKAGKDGCTAFSAACTTACDASGRLTEAERAAAAQAAHVLVSTGKVKAEAVAGGGANHLAWACHARLPDALTVLLSQPTCTDEAVSHRDIAVHVAVVTATRWARDAAEKGRVLSVAEAVRAGECAALLRDRLVDAEEEASGLRSLKLPIAQRQWTAEEAAAGTSGTAGGGVTATTATTATSTTAAAATGATAASASALSPAGDDSHYRKIGKPIGMGTFGVVYEVAHKASGRKFALKKLRNNGGSTAPFDKEPEIVALRRVGPHPNIVTLHDAFSRTHTYTRQLPPYDDSTKTEEVTEFAGSFLLLELMDTTMYGLVRPARRTWESEQARGVGAAPDADIDVPRGIGPRGERVMGLHPTIIKWYTYQILRGVKACHNAGVVHGNLASNNLLLNSSGDLKLGGFTAAGLNEAAVEAGPLHLTNVANNDIMTTVWWRAPEVLLGQPVCGAEIDMWAVGCTLAEMATGVHPMAAECYIGQIHAIFHILGHPTEAQWPGVTALPYYSPDLPAFRPKPMRVWAAALDDTGRDLLASLLAYDPARRPTAAEALAHPWFAEVHDSPTFEAQARALAAEKVKSHRR